YQEWTPSRLIEWAAKTGPATAQVVEHILTSRPHPKQGYRACLGILRLGTHYGPARVEAAAHRAVHFRACSYKAIRTMLATGLDRVALPEADAPRRLLTHENVRGATYYHPSPQEDPSC